MSYGLAVLTVAAVTAGTAAAGFLAYVLVALAVATWRER